MRRAFFHLALNPVLPLGCRTSKLTDTGAVCENLVASMTRPQSNRSAAGTMGKKERMGYNAILANPHPKSITRKSEIWGE